MQDDQGNSEGQVPEAGNQADGEDKRDFSPPIVPDPGLSQPDTGSQGSGEPGVHQPGQPGPATSSGPGGHGGYGPGGPGGYGPGPYGPGPGGPGAGAPGGPGGYGPGGYGPGAGGPAGYGPPGYGPGGYGPGGYGPGAGGPGGYGPAGYGPGGYGPAGYGPGGYGSGGYGQPGYTPQPGRRRRAFLAYLTVAVVAAAAGAGITGYLVSGNSPAPSAASGNHGTINPSNPFGNNPFGQGGGTSNGKHGITSASQRAAVNAVKPGLVDISSNLQYEGDQAAATGMIISSNGLVLTNNHVINGTTQLYATVLADGHKYAARWLGYDATDDVAVIQLINAHGLRTVPLGDSNTVRVGDKVIAIGNAYGQDKNPAYAGSITGVGRTITASDNGSTLKETLHNMLQTDAGIVSGDSGGPLVSASGKVIGMDTAAETGGSFGTTSQNVGFAIPINRALRIAHQIIGGHGSSQVQIGSTGFMGVLVPAGAASDPTSPAQQRHDQLKQDQGTTGQPVQPSSRACLENDLYAGVPTKVAPVSSGALVIGQLCSTPANKAGIIAGDVITNVGGKRVNSPADLTGVMSHFKPGDSVKVTWETVAGQTKSASLVLITAPPH